MWTSRVRTQRVFARVNHILDSRTLRSPPLNLRYQEFGKVRNMDSDKRQHQHCVLSAHFVDLSLACDWPGHRITAALAARMPVPRRAAARSHREVSHSKHESETVT